MALHTIINFFLRRAWTGQFAKRRCTHLGMAEKVEPASDVIGFEATFAVDRRNLELADDDRALSQIHDRFSQLDTTQLAGLRELGRHIWSPALDQRFNYGLSVLLDGLAMRAPVSKANTTG